ncbi:MAG: hypothetical protein ABSE82_16000 [Nitrososphaerales archaeon]|jgi:hypothetical protein
MKVYPMKSGDTFTSPSLFVNLQHPRDAEAMHIASNRGLPNIDGLVIDMLDYKYIAEELGFNDQSLIPATRSDASQKLRLIDPTLHYLLTGNDEQKERMLATKLFDARLQAPIKGMMRSDLGGKEKTRMIIDQVYPYLTVRPHIEFQLRNGASAIISPCVNITSMKNFAHQLSKATQMLTDTRTLLETSLKGYSETRDLINVLTIRYKLAEPINYPSLFKLALCNGPDQVGFRFLGITESDTVGVDNMFQFLRNFSIYSMDVLDRKEPIPMHLFNVDELGYAGYCNGVCNIVSPLATSPYYAFPSKRNRDGDEVDNTPTYYDPGNMNQPKARTIDRLRCTCPECSRFKFMDKVPKSYLPTFRRVHWLHCKDEEIRQFRETPVRLDTALRAKFAQSMRTQLAAYIPETPIFAVY